MRRTISPMQTTLTLIVVAPAAWAATVLIKSALSSFVPIDEVAELTLPVANTRNSRSVLLIRVSHHHVGVGHSSRHRDAVARHGRNDSQFDRVFLW